MYPLVTYLNGASSFQKQQLPLFWKAKRFNLEDLRYSIFILKSHFICYLIQTRKEAFKLHVSAVSMTSLTEQCRYLKELTPPLMNITQTEITRSWNAHERLTVAGLRCLLCKMAGSASQVQRHTWRMLSTAHQAAVMMGWECRGEMKYTV